MKVKHALPEGSEKSPEQIESEERKRKREIESQKSISSEWVK